VSAPIKLDLGAGEVSPPGFVPLGRDHGSEIFPLPHADETVDEVYASHVLEHFPHGQIEAVLADWVRVLKKGGRLRVAVPDFAKIAQSYLDGNQGPHQSWLMGGQTDANDFHKAIFDRDRLRQLFAKNNLVLVQSWASEIGDCADVPISLNLEGYKPHRSELKVSGAMSVPRLGFMDNFFNCMEACLPCHVKLRKHGGAFWGQAMENVFERILEEDDADFILAIDYDSTFLPRHLARLMQVMTLYPEIDALAPIQSSRHLKTTLFTVEGADGNEPSISRTDLSGENDAGIDGAFRPDADQHRKASATAQAMVSRNPVSEWRLARRQGRRRHPILAEMDRGRQQPALGEPRRHRPHGIDGPLAGYQPGGHVSVDHGLPD
jgi:predicted SAM-dependent methyltransferase